jgi:RecJ-like exonuclease
VNFFEFDPHLDEAIDQALTAPKLVRVPCGYCKGKGAVANGDGYQCCTQCMARGYVVTEAQ